MKQIIKALSRGDKFYNLERVHSKLLYYLRADHKKNIDNFPSNMSTAIDVLISIAKCFSNDVCSKQKIEYLQSLNQLKNSIQHEYVYMDVFRDICYCHSTFVKFKREYAKLSLKTCEDEYHGVCVYLLPIEIECKKRRAMRKVNK